MLGNGSEYFINWYGAFIISNPPSVLINLEGEEVIPHDINM